MNNLIPSVKVLIEQVILKAQSNENKSYNFDNFHTDFPNAHGAEYNQVFQGIIKYEYAKRLYSNSVIYLTTKGEKFKSFKIEERKNWFKNLPSENWLLADITKTIAKLLIGAAIGWFGKTLSYNLNKPQSAIISHPSNIDSNFYKIRK